MTRIVFSLFLALFAALHTLPALANDADSLADILNDHWQAANKEQIFFRKDPDTFRMNGPLPDVSEQGRARRAAFNLEILKRLDAIDTTKLTRQDQITARLFKYERLTTPAFLLTSLQRPAICPF